VASGQLRAARAARIRGLAPHGCRLASQRRSMFASKAGQSSRSLFPPRESILPMLSVVDDVTISYRRAVVGAPSDVRGRAGLSRGSKSGARE